MGVLDGLRSRSEAINARRVEQDETMRRRADRRPDFLPDDWPEGQPYVSLSAAYAGAEGEAVSDTVTTRAVDPNAPEGGRLSDAAIAGWAVQAALASRTAAANELRRVAQRAGGRA